MHHIKIHDNPKTTFMLHLLIAIFPWLGWRGVVVVVIVLLLVWFYSILYGENSFSITTCWTLLSPPLPRNNLCFSRSIIKMWYASPWYKYILNLNLSIFLVILSIPQYTILWVCRITNLCLNLSLWIIWMNEIILNVRLIIIFFKIL